MKKTVILVSTLLLLTACSDENNPPAVHASFPAEQKDLRQLCVSHVSKTVLSREQKISSVARRWTYGGGAKYGSGGIGRASVEADTWSDLEKHKLAVWKDNELRRCNSSNRSSQALQPKVPPPFSNIEQGSQRSKNKGRLTPKYKTAITINRLDMCPMDLSLGRLSHFTPSGMSQICYYK